MNVSPRIHTPGSSVGRPRSTPATPSCGEPADGGAAGPDTRGQGGGEAVAARARAWCRRAPAVRGGSAVREFVRAAAARALCAAGDQPRGLPAAYARECVCEGNTKQHICCSKCL